LLSRILNNMLHLVFTLCLFLGLPLFADGESTLPLPQDQPPLPVEDYGAAFFKMIMMLLSILVLVILTVWVIKRWGHGRLGRFKDKQSIHILEKRILSPKTALYLIEIEGSQLLVAESQLEVRPLHQWQAPKETDS
jgi:hypothetical protein